MGLDTVNLVMAVEEEFGFQLPDLEAAKMERVGDMFQFILHTLRERGEGVDDAVIWTRLSDVIVEQLGVKPEHVTPSAHFIRDLKAD
jgi:acyl carrier protein